MSDNEHVIKLFDVGTRSRELWSDVCSFAVVVAIFAVGWLFESDAMQWLGFVAISLAVIGRATVKVKKFGPQEAADWLHNKYGVTASEAQDT